MDQDRNMDFKEGEFIKTYGKSLDFKSQKINLAKLISISYEDTSQNTYFWLTGVESMTKSWIIQEKCCSQC